MSEFNTILLNKCGGDVLYVSTTVTPVTEEIAKALPILFMHYRYYKSKKSA